MGFFGQLVGMAGILKRSFGMKHTRREVAFFVVLLSGAMGVRREFVHLGGLSV